MSGIPRLSHLQFLVVGLLRDQDRSGRELRRLLQDFDVRKSGPAFYQLMARLEVAGLVEGEYRQEIVSSQIIRERHYTISAQGSQAWHATREFYQKVIEGLGGWESPARA